MYGLNGKNTLNSNSDLILVGYGDYPEGVVNKFKKLHNCFLFRVGQDIEYIHHY